MRLLPPNVELGWTPYIWLIYLGFFFIHPILDRVGWETWLATALGTAVFLVLYFRGYWLRDRRCLWIIAAIALMGVGFAPFNAGASVFIIYAAAFVAFTGDSKFAAKLLVALVAVVGVETFVFHLSPWFWITGSLLSIAIGSANIHFVQRSQANRQLRLAQEEIEQLARLAERERIARDLHDVLGHTLSLVILKSELASKLILRDPKRAGEEIHDVEQISRKALAEVRHAISGYRAGGLEEELARANAILRTAGIATECLSLPMTLSPTQETVLALAMREAVTNVVRHSHARNCRLRIEQLDACCLLEIQDDGHGGQQIEGNGVRGMRERVEALGGTLRREIGAGTRLIIKVPLTTGSRSGLV
ncbi:sensor histidine kinase [Terriglobus sp. RCC_193]|uniref:sensor histidine kinase n=1 Tax=Terriglobus sp. RCC_193 TaxID=3239218 RepID=UPI003523FB39